MIKVKAVTWDRLPARALKYIVEKGGELKARLFDYFKKQILKGKDSVHFTGRLMLLIKNEDKPASNSNLRPIAISSNIVKIFEQILKNRTETILENAMDHNQIGFVRQMGCEVHI